MGKISRRSNVDDDKDAFVFIYCYRFDLNDK